VTTTENNNAASAVEPTPRSRMKSVNIELPDYLWTDLKIRAAKQQVSVRHIIMSALKGQGVEISDADMIEDGRRLRT
jgi:plasmid stability protein